MPFYAEECASMLAVTFSSGGTKLRSIVGVKETNTLIHTHVASMGDQTSKFMKSGARKQEIRELEAGKRITASPFTLNFFG